MDSCKKANRNPFAENLLRVKYPFFQTSEFKLRIRVYSTVFERSLRV